MLAEPLLVVARIAATLDELSVPYIVGWVPREFGLRHPSLDVVSLLIRARRQLSEE